MSIATNSIGDCDFVRFSRAGDPSAGPEMLRTEIEAVERFNTDGTGFLIGGEKGPQFEMESFRDADTLLAAHQLAQTYRDKIGEKEILIWQGIDWETEFGANYFIEDVKNVRIRKVLAAVGGLSSSKGAVIYATWVLRPVPQ